MEVLCVHETKWKGDRARKMAEGYDMLHAGYGRSNGVGIVVNVDQQGGGRSGETAGEDHCLGVEEERVGGRGHVLPEGEPHTQERTAQYRA